jgi:hypothetical protein
LKCLPERHRKIYRKSRERKEAERRKIKTGFTRSDDDGKEISDMEESEEEVVERARGTEQPEAEYVCLQSQ